MAEQIVGQELLAYDDTLFDPQVYTWSRDKTGSSAEVDFVITYNQKILPIEVKSGSTGKLKSLKIFLDEKKSPLGIRISQHELSLHEKILSIPIYAVSQVNRLLEQAMGLINFSD